MYYDNLSGFDQYDLFIGNRSSFDQWNLFIDKLSGFDQWNIFIDMLSGFDQWNIFIDKLPGFNQWNSSLIICQVLTNEIWHRARQEFIWAATSFWPLDFILHCLKFSRLYDSGA